MVIAEELLLQLTRADGTGVRDNNYLGLGAAGAMLLELHQMGRVDLDPRGRVVVLNGTGTGSPLLDQALAAIAEREGRKPKDMLPTFSKAARLGAYAALTSRGLVREERHRILGLFPRTVWPVVAQANQERTRAELAAVLVGQVRPDRRTGALISLIQSLDAVPKVFAGAGGLSQRELKSRAKTIAEGAWASEAVRKAIADMQTAVLAGVTAATTAAVAGGS